jgi:hypothetical protein
MHPDIIRAIINEHVRELGVDAKADGRTRKSRTRKSRAR